MKKLILNILLFLFLFLAVAFFLNGTLDFVFRKSKSTDFYIVNSAFQFNLNQDYLFLGNSRVKGGIDPTMFSEVTGCSVRGLGIDGSEIQLQSAILDIILQRDNKPKNIVINIDYYSFANPPDLYNKFQYLPYIGLNSFSNELFKVDKNIKYEKIVPLLKYRGYFGKVFKELSYFLSGNELSDLYKNKGFELIKSDWAGESNLKMLQHSGKINYNKAILESSFSTLIEMIHKCKASNIGVQLIYFPQYYELTELLYNHSKFINEIEKIAKSENIVFWNYCSLSQISNSKTNFKNASHMNSSGAQKFTIVLSNRIISDKAYLKQSK